MKWTTDEFTGKRFGKYEVLCRLAIGGMAEIFLGFATTGPFANRPVVLKRILAEQREDPGALQMLIDEAKLTATLSHPNVAQVLDLEVDAEDVLLVIEFISGANLEELVEAYTRRQELVPLGFALAAVREAAQGLAHAHTHKDSRGDVVPIIHRDVTPRNVMVDFDGAIKVLDFGIARAKGSARRTQAGMVRGTTAYMSPEQAIGKEPDPRSDLFSLGILFHEMLTGQRLFYKGNPAQEMAAVYEAEIPLPSKANRRVPKALDPVVMRLLERKLDKRYQTAAEFIRDLSFSAGSTMWAKDRLAETVRGAFAERQTESDSLLARIPAKVADNGEGRTVITQGPLPNPFLEAEAPQRTLLSSEPLVGLRPRRAPAREPEPAREHDPIAITDPARMVPAQVRPEAKAEQLFDTPNEMPEVTTRVAAPAAQRRQLPAPAAAGEARPRPSQRAKTEKKGSSAPLVFAAIAALAVGAGGGAVIAKSMQKPSSMVRVTIDADRPVDVVLQGQVLGRTPVTAVFPTGHHQLLLREDATTKVFEVDVRANAENRFEVKFDTLRSE